MRVAFIDKAVYSSSINPCQKTEFWHKIRECDETNAMGEGESDDKCYLFWLLW
jgi:hypothetical protein